MKKTGRRSWGFTLIELIFLMVLVSIVAVGVAPLVAQVFSHVHVVKEGVQGHFLLRAVLAQTYARYENGMFDQIVSEENCLDSDGENWTAGFPFHCQMVVVGADFNAVAGTLGCKSDLSANEGYKCVTVTIRRIDTGGIITQETASFSRN